MQNFISKSMTKTSKILDKIIKGKDEEEFLKVLGEVAIYDNLFMLDKERDITEEVLASAYEIETSNGRVVVFASIEGTAERKFTPEGRFVGDRYVIEKVLLRVKGKVIDFDEAERNKRELFEYMMQEVVAKKLDIGWHHVGCKEIKVLHEGKMSPKAIIELSEAVCST